MMRFLGGVALVSCTTGADAADILVLSSMDGEADTAIIQTLESHGHNVTLGPTAQDFDGSMDLSGYGAVLLQIGYNWGYGDMPGAGQKLLRDWTNAGGGLVTGEWLSYLVHAGCFQTLEPALPFAATGSYDDRPTATYTKSAVEPLINAGLPDSFAFPLVNYDGGAEGELIAKDGVTVFYESSNLAGGLIGWQPGAGRVLSFSGTLGPDQVNDPEFGLLLSNTLSWAAGGGRCYADFSGDGVLDLFDLLGYFNSFNAGDEAADCNTDGVLDLFDYLCFVNEFNVGC